VPNEASLFVSLHCIRIWGRDATLRSLMIHLSKNLAQSRRICLNRWYAEKQVSFISHYPEGGTR
jgi:hypothetical protein